MRKWAIALAAALISTSASPPPKTAIWRLDCGKFLVNDYDKLGPRELSNGCYLIRHGSAYMLWDLGLDEGLIGHPEVTAEQTVSLDEGLMPQLARLGIQPSQISVIGISHYHGDHLAQVGHFPQATLFAGKADFEVIKGTLAGARLFAPWIEGRSPVVLATSDRNVFGDGAVKMISTPGHTPGHMSLLVRMPDRNVLLSGDAVHLREQLATRIPPGNGTDLAAARRSLSRLVAVAKRMKATIVVQHEPKDVPLIPGVPKAG